jgi:thiaminase/transcriptional activator TenA
MAAQKFYNEIRSKTDSLWQAILKHHFVQGIGKGDLAQDRYEFFLKQDYVYLVEFSRVMALGTAKGNSLIDMGYFATMLQGTLNVEMDLHRKTCAAFGIPPETLEKTEPAMITTAYTNLLVRTCYEGDFADIMAVLLPCATGYVEIGKKLKEQGLPEDKFYRDWINTYSSKEFEDFANWLIDRMDQLAEGAEQKRKDKWFKLYQSSVYFEYLFFEMSWKKEFWPDGIPIK